MTPTVPKRIEFSRQLESNPIISGQVAPVASADPGRVGSCVYTLIGDGGTNVRLESSANGTQWEMVALVFGDDKIVRRNISLVAKSVRFRNSGVGTANDGLFFLERSTIQLPSTGL